MTRLPTSYFGQLIMTLRFSEHGPVFPSKLVDALMAGEVVFLCGAGVSAPQLHGFQKLVDLTFERLNVEMSTSEANAYNGGRFEEVLGSLERRLAEAGRMVRAVSDLLSVPDEPELDHHATLLRLSRDLENRILIVTTNFDTLLERASSAVAPDPVPAKISFAGQSLPAPSSAEFSGIIHLHGRLADDPLDLTATPLVLTSSEYGDAYMRSGWASRFLFDLARCKTIVLIGYSANDAPVRYFLNVLEADRSRFPGLHQVYAFDSFHENPADAEAAWGTLAVTPLVYCKTNPQTGHGDHSPLWNDLEQLAEVIERPKLQRNRRAEAILSSDDATPNNQVIEELKWLFTGRGDLWPVAINSVVNGAWFQIFQDNALWSADEASWVLPAWISKKFEDADRFRLAAEWAPRLGKPYLVHLDRLYRQAPSQDEFWNRMWRLLMTNQNSYADDPEVTNHVIKQRLESPLVLETDLQQAVDALKPRLTIKPQFRLRQALADDGILDVVEVKEPRRLADLVWSQMTIGDAYGANEIVTRLDGLKDRSPRIFELTVEALRSAIAEGVDLGMIDDELEYGDFALPSIENHEQNERREGVAFLIRALVNAYGQVVEINRDLARGGVQQLPVMPGKLGVRIQLHAMRSREGFTGDEAMDTLLSLSDGDFWNIRREVAVLLRDRSDDAGADKVAAVEARICETGDAFFERYEIREGQVDWRGHARDSDVWLRLKMLEQAGTISEAGIAELGAIRGRSDFFDREVEDRDFFGSYTFGVSAVLGDASPIEQADPDERLQVAVELGRSPNFEQQLGWKTYCRTNPEGAFETLSAAELNEPNLLLWADFIGTLSFGADNTKAIREELVVRCFGRLTELAPVPFKLANQLVNAMIQGRRRLIVDLEGWFDRLADAIDKEDPKTDLDKDLDEAASLHCAGRLAQIQIMEIDHSRSSEGEYLARQIARLRKMVENPATAGSYARAICVRDMAFLLNVDPDLVTQVLCLAIDADTGEGRSLRRILVTVTSISPEVSRLIPQAIVKGAIESQTDRHSSQEIAARILRPALASLRQDRPERWGLSENDVATVLRDAPAPVRRGALDILVRWMHADNAGAAEAWRIMVGPFFDKVWPKERRFVDEANNSALMDLAVGAGTRFPEALLILKPYMAPYRGNRASFHGIIGSQAPEQFPKDLLSMIWRVVGRSDVKSHDLAELLDRLVKADPSVEVDRRFQALEQKAMRFS